MIMLDQLRPLLGTSYELPRLREKVTPDNITLIPHRFPIMTCGFPLPSDILYSGYGTSSHEVKVLWCLILFLINYNILACAAATFPQTVTTLQAGVAGVLLEWMIKVLPASTEHTSFRFLS